MTKKQIQITEERSKQLKELEEFENAAITIAVITKDIINKVIEKHKTLNVGFSDQMERMAWKRTRDAAASLDLLAFASPYCDYKKFKKSVLIVEFLILELISRCDNSNMRVWQFHNLLKSFPVVYPAVAPTIEDEQKAFANLFKNDSTSATK